MKTTASRWNRPRLGLFSRFLGLFGLTTLALAFCIAAGAALISEEKAPGFCRRKERKSAQHVVFVT